MKKKGKRQQMAKSTSTLGVNTTKVDAKSEEKNFFKKWFRWDRLAAIATVIMLIISLWQLLPKPEVKKTKEKIRNNIELVERTFQPDKTLEENDSSEYLILLRKLQQSTLDFCMLWKSVENAEPLSKYVDTATSDLENVMRREFNRISQIDSAAIIIFESIRDLQTFEYLKDKNHITNISHGKQDDIIEATKAKQEVDSLCMKESSKYLLNAYNDKVNNREYMSNLKKAMKSLDKLKNKVDHYRRDDKILDYAIECNELFTISSKYYKDK